MAARVKAGWIEALPEPEADEGEEAASLPKPPRRPPRRRPRPEGRRCGRAMAEVEATPPEDGLDPGGLDSGPGGRAPERTCIVTRVDPGAGRDDPLRARAGRQRRAGPARQASGSRRLGQRPPGRRRPGGAQEPVLAGVQGADPGRADLPDRIVAALRDDLRQAIALANKAGCIVAGFSKVEAAIGGHPGAIAVIHASEASPDGRRKIASALHRRHGEAMSRIPIIDDLSEDELDMALGRGHVIHAALVAGAGAAGCLSRWRRLRSFESAAAATEEPDLARIGRIDQASR